MSWDWQTGNWSSSPDNGRCFIERTDHNDVDASEQEWHVFYTDDGGRMIEGFPKLTEECFAKVELAQAWVEENLA